MIGYTIDTSKGKMEVVKVEIEKTSYDTAKCRKEDNSYLYKRVDQCFESYSDAKKHMEEVYFISKFKNRMKHRKYKTWKCVYCGRVLYNKKDVTVDHVVPKAKGGKTTEDNLVICCASCNKMKSSKHKNHYIKLMRNNAKIKMGRPGKFKGKIRKVAYQAHGVDIETIARMDSNVISIKGLNLKRNKQNMVDKVLAEYNNGRRNK